MATLQSSVARPSELRRQGTQVLPNTLDTARQFRDAHPFRCVQEMVYSRIDAVGGIQPNVSGQTYLSVVNIEYIFFNFLDRFALEMGVKVHPESQSLHYFAESLFETYFGMYDSFDHAKNPSANQVLANVEAWNKLTVDYLLLSTIGAYNRHANYQKRYRDPKYGMGRIEPIAVTSAKAKRKEENALQTYAGLSSKLGKPLYPVRDYC